MIMRLLLIILISIIIFGCQPKNNFSFSEPVTISGDKPSGCAYFTQDHQGNAVLCWTEEEKKSARLLFSTFDYTQQKFGNAIVVSPSTGTGLHSESMNKVAFKPDGTIVAVYEKKHPTDENKYAGSILYTQSFDNGMTWTKEKHLHSDSIPVYSRSFFDIALLPDGEIGAVWLDGRLNLGKEGSALFFSKTKGREGFQADYQVAETVCECCRTDIQVDQQNNVHIVFRDIEPTLEGQIRDFAHIVSADNGATFIKTENVSNDKWIIDGCPHTGASMASLNGRLSVSWFTAGGTAGLYLTSASEGGNTFQPRRLLSIEGRHPQITTQGDHLIAVWDNVAPTGHDHHNTATSSHHQPEETAQISFAKWNDDNYRIFPIPKTEDAEFPVICSIDNTTTIIAYTKDQRVEYQLVRN
jgi:hypothetical protein